jgi:demethylspheroidene O-methyltransferase
MKLDVTARGWMSLLYHGEKAIDVLRASLELGLLERLDAGPVSLAELSERMSAVPGRLYKLLDALESLGLVERTDVGESRAATRYVSVESLAPAARAVLGPDSIERGRDQQSGWRQIAGRLTEVLRGGSGISEAAFSWPPRTPEQIAGFEESMAMGCPPIAESFVAGAERLWGRTDRALRLLDVGGGDGTLARHLVAAHPWLHVDVYNLPAVAPLCAQQRALSAAPERLGFVGGDFLAEPLPDGYDALSFVRVLHDWPAPIARKLLVKAFAALPPGGRLFICEELRTHDRLAIQFFWTYFLIGVDSCVSRLRDADGYLATLREIGFTEASLVSGPFDVIVAIRP